MTSLMETAEAKAIRKILKEVQIETENDVFSEIIYNSEETGLPENLSWDFIFWVVANEKMKGTKCEDCYWVAESCLSHQGDILNWCNDCAYSPFKVLPVKYKKVDDNLSIFE